MRIKPGVKIKGIKPETTVGMMIVDSVYKSFNAELIVTAVTDGEHMKGSLHYEGLAFDCRTHMFSKKMQDKVYLAIKGALGSEWDVVMHKTHIHIEFDPK